MGCHNVFFNPVTISYCVIMLKGLLSHQNIVYESVKVNQTFRILMLGVRCYVVCGWSL